MSPSIDECSTGSYVYDINANCTNTDGSHNCIREEGYTGDGQSCQGIIYCVTFCTSLTLLDIDECSNGSHDCDVNANFSNINGSYSCTCKEGYTGKGESCQGKIRLDFKKGRITVYHK